MPLKECMMTMTCDFTSFSTMCQSYQDDGRLIMKELCNGAPFTVAKFSPQVGIKLDLLAGFSLTPYLESFTPTFGLGTPVFPRIFSNLHCGTPTFLKDVSGTPIFKILVRTLC